MGEEPEPSCVGHRGHDVGGAQPVVVDLLLQAEGEVVIAARGRHLFADAHQHPTVVALAAAPPGLERVVVGEQHGVDARVRRGRGDLLDRAGAVGVQGMGVHDAAEIGRGHRREP